MKKTYEDAEKALAGVLTDDLTIAAGGFGLCGIPENLITAVVNSNIKNISYYGNNVDHNLSLIHISEPTRLLSIE